MDLGVDINLVLPLGTSVFDLRTAARAWANIPCDHAISCTTGSFLRDAYHQPSLSHMPYGVYNTGRFIEELGALTGKDFSAYIASKEKETVGKWKEYLVSRDLSKLRVCIFGDYTASLGLAQTMKKDFHSQILMAGTYDTVHKDLFTEQAREVSGTVLVTDDSREVWENIRQLDPHLVMGTLNEERLCSIHKIPFIGISMPSRYIQTSLYPVETFLGYSGFDHLLGSIRRLFPK
jgi:light-independent protochlorophyllide reductase subunit B